jgi:hypothetical protein
VINSKISSNNLEEIPALLKISQTQHYKDNVMAQMMYMAAVVEILSLSRLFTALMMLLNSELRSAE